MHSSKRNKENRMIIYSKSAFDAAQSIARDAVEGKSENGFEFDWSAAMVMLRVAYGHYPLDFAEKYYREG
ncbi:hypothetical protein [Escherichia phage vB_EcoS_PHB17]|uniref:Uncharacterized protein n=1 Tax=Escherichia phage vB_EcoS_PHB17 TaxID=2591407 RepID=A0A514DKR7_9CAUD|nr:hypothetical protein KMB84_gp65 [Escherichia phage vB_EcoS_PHB17]QDH94268.1 hypothetical protein [Escherichia phage vB_EcoS_PHB17]